MYLRKEKGTRFHSAETGYRGSAFISDDIIHIESCLKTRIN